ncbi:MAG: curli assembly protein CsgF [Gammaproteobacteria bacterium]|jgi:curli production assembly/transport component CsgF|nr:curli assembly protein CsgF [Gammaproteobacteria bacterium]
MNKLNVVVVMAASLVAAGAALAGPLVYQPVNPSFGGNPLNGTVLLNEAQSQNNYTAPVRKLSPADRLANFQQNLQNAILSRVQSAVLSKIVGVDGGLVPGTVETQDYIITVVDNGGTVTVTTTDRTTGQTSTFEIGSTTDP